MVSQKEGPLPIRERGGEERNPHSFPPDQMRGKGGSAHTIALRERGEEGLECRRLPCSLTEGKERKECAAPGVEDSERGKKREKRGGEIRLRFIIAL